MPKVVVLGGGVAGLSAAHELVRRGFQVEVYERNPDWGGKARSMDVPGAVPPGKKPLPGEHGFRFFPGFYKHIIDTMRNIPLGQGRTVADNLGVATEIAIAQEALPPYIFKAQSPTTIAEWIECLKDLLSAEHLGLTKSEVAFFVSRLVCYLTSCEDRRIEKYENQSWFDFIKANLSPAYERLLARGLTLMLVAMKANQASANTVSKILLQILIDIVDKTRDADRILNAPTSEAWIKPWLNHLSLAGVTLCSDAEVTGLTFGANHVSGATIVRAGVAQLVTGDYYVLALPVEVARRVLTDAQMAQAGILGIKGLNLAWMNGVIFYLDKDVALSKGHGIYADAPWAVTALSQPQFWPGINLGQYAGGNVKGILSAIISDWDTPGNKLVNVPARQCSAAQIKSEVWEQIKAHHIHAAPGAQLGGVTVLDSFLDPAIRHTGGIVTNSEPLLINDVGSRSKRPRATTAVPNLFLAADYVLTKTELACMEGANEAARMAVNAILVASGSAQSPCQIWPLEEPAIFEGLKQADAILYRLDKNSHAPLCLEEPVNVQAAAASVWKLPALILGFTTLALLVLVLYLLFR